MRLRFASSVIESLKRSGDIHENSSVLAVCAGAAERDLFEATHLRQVIISSLDPVVLSEAIAPYTGRMADVRSLPFGSKEFDWVFVSDGLHHCDSPHQALLEMYRVARKGVIVFESRDSLLMRLAVSCRLTEDYEITAVTANGGTCGGVNYTSVPNYVYRWTEREFEKVISCADPTGRPHFRFFYGFNAPSRDYRGAKALVFDAVKRGAALLAKVFKKQSNSFCMVALKPKELFPWLVYEGERVRFNARA
jgi:SAM-dependent methyltransferase